MNPFEKYQQQSRENFVRTVGLPLDQFRSLVEQIQAPLQDQKQSNHFKKMAFKPELSLENPVLLTLIHFRDYPTFIKLGLQFGISESYANNIYHNISDLMVKILPVKNRQVLFENPFGTLVVDATKQPIERPNKGQKAYFSGKKKDTRSKSSSLSV